jgi:hypothetical protein
MAPKHRHEEHVNHERWVISYADMVTLLFALFVVLYALGEVKLRRLKELKKSIAFAFHFEGEGKTQDEGEYDRGESGGDVSLSAPLLNAQQRAMQEFLLETLPKEFEERTGRSLEIVQTDDTVAFRAPLSTFFPPNQRYMRAGIGDWLQDLVKGAYSFTARIRVRIEAPKLRIGTLPDGTAVMSRRLCLDRLEVVHRFLLLTAAMSEDVLLEFRYRDAAELGGGIGGTWEERSFMTFAFTNAPDGADSLVTK